MSQTETVSYDDKIVRLFIIATILWGVIGMLVGVVIASQLTFPILNFDLPWLTFGRLRPLHTNAVIFAFAGNTIFAGIYYSTQRLLKTRMFSDKLSAIHFWGWQLIIVAAAITLPLGITASKEYAELEWPIDIAITVVWVVFAINFFGALYTRREKHIYVAIWFYIATIITVAMLHIINSLAIPVSLYKSYPIYSGVQDALVQWWYGHNAVAFFLTTPFLGLMYYFVPKAADRPVFSYRLSIIHFWSLIFLYIWSGPHHLLNSSLPDWAQTMGVVFSIALIAPSWGGMINGLLTLRGAWDKLRTDPVLKFMVVGLTFYGMSTFEGPMMAIKSVNALTHYTDYTIGHVHSGALGWNGFISFGMMYYLVPKLWKIPFWSQKLIIAHFWMGTIGILLYVTSMWAGGITQSLMWRALTPEGALKYPDFIETVVRMKPFYFMRLVGGTLYLVGMIVMAYNFFKTVAMARAQKVSLTDPHFQVALKNLDHEEDSSKHPTPWHRKLEGAPLWFTIFTLIAVFIGGPFEFVPLTMINASMPKNPKIQPYTPLELVGRDIYVSEGCYNCHSQMVRPFADEILRYGEYSKSSEFVYDHPFQFGSKRTGPDLHRVGGKYPNAWHYNHMIDPASLSQGSIMPRYPWLVDNKFDLDELSVRLKVMKTLGVPYTDSVIENSKELYLKQAGEIKSDLVTNQTAPETLSEESEMLALIAYLQRLGTDIKKDVSQ